MTDCVPFMDAPFLSSQMMVVWGKGKLRTNFPIENRTDRPQKLSSLQRLLDATKTRSLLFRMADFHVLLFLANVMRVDMDVRTPFPV